MPRREAHFLPGSDVATQVENTPPPSRSTRASSAAGACQGHGGVPGAWTRAAKTVQVLLPLLVAPVSATKAARGGYANTIRPRLQRAGRCRTP